MCVPQCVEQDGFFKSIELYGFQCIIFDARTCSIGHIAKSNREFHQIAQTIAAVGLFETPRFQSLRKQAGAAITPFSQDSG
jgi:hypothetical protein